MTNGRVAGSAQGSRRHCSSSILKLNNAKYHADTLLSYEAVGISRPPPNLISGIAISATSVSSPNDYDVSRELDNFFSNLLSAYDMVAQVVNCIYLSSMYDVSEVYFRRVSGAMARNLSLSSDALTLHLDSLRAQGWYKDMRDFRHVETHRNAIDFELRRPFARPFVSASMKTRIVLPDNPFSYPSTHYLNRDFDKFGMDILRNTLNTIDQMYGIMETRIRVAGQIPI